MIDNDNVDNNDFIASPKGTEPFPFYKKSRYVANRYPYSIIAIPQEICYLLKINKGQMFKVYCEIENDRIILQKLTEEEVAKAMQQKEVNNKEKALR